ncbi:DUF5689 domain-containing protein [Cellulophaga sp. F20128]|uniref:DUF5689 domain-containing protein n=1 Tax=Cellulophaga sp. F20128 TaxID=2926413 RepID=UPI001FF49533|nr:DUF5689 domain-containing protein [Cellulophaga sp. F20128]MCK0157438.1 DUF5689 domain-containing protein [Cellulophaga sp. F20128]
MMNKKSIYTLILFNIICLGCVKDKDFDIPKTTCSELLANTTFEELKSLSDDGIVHIQDDLIIEGYIISSDIEGNFFGTIHLQDKHTNPTMGLEFHIDLREHHLLYKSDSKVFVKLKGLYLDTKNDAILIGGVFSSFGNKSVGRLPSLQVSEHLFVSCDDQQATPTKTSLSNLKDQLINTLIELDSLEIVDNELGLSFAEPKLETERTLKDCHNNEIKLLNSGYADFQARIVPDKNGSISAVLVKEGNEYKLRIRSLHDINFTNNRCPEIVTEFTSTNIFISEIADPNNNTGARFVELYNSGTEHLSLNHWKLNRYTNYNTEVSSTIDLSAYTINAESALIISPNANEFETVYGFPPDIAVGVNSPADSNGDDNLELVDPFGTVIDVFGIIGEDGSGTNHEFEDGRALRKPEITQANKVYSFNEWVIFNDTGALGTTNLPQNAPQDFSPGVR